MGNKDYSVRRLLEMEACTNCRSCADVCPAVLASNDGTLSAVYRLKELKQVLKGRASFFNKFFKREPFSSEELMQFSNTAFRCTLCGNCQEICPAGIKLKDLWLSLRQDMVHSDAYPKKIDMIKDNLDESHNVFAEDNDERADWVQEMDEAPDHNYIKDTAEVVYFTGCVAAYFPMAQKIPMALAEVLDKCGVNFTLLGKDEWCCGFPLLGAGLKEFYNEIVEHNIQAVKDRGAKEVVFACPSCYEMWKEHYHTDIKLYHSTQYFIKLIKEGRVPVKKLNFTVTYHDPCDLGRGAREFDAPREVIKAIPGVKFIELPQNRENCQCCGGGGNLEMIDADLSASISKRKIDQVLSTGADVVLSSCQQCLRTMSTYVRRNKVPLQVMDVTQLLHKALDVEQDED